MNDSEVVTQHAEHNIGDKYTFSWDMHPYLYRCEIIKKIKDKS